jgi:hypothetical protein
VGQNQNSISRFKLHFEAFGTRGEFDKWFRPDECVEKLRWRNRTKLSVLSPSNVWRDCVIVAQGHERVIVTDSGERKSDGWQVSQQDSKKSGGTVREPLEGEGDSGNGSGTNTGVKIHYVGFDYHNDEWLPLDSDRIRWTAQYGRVCDCCGESEHADGAIFNHGQTGPEVSFQRQTAPKTADSANVCLRCVIGESSCAQTLPADSAVDSTLSSGTSSKNDSTNGGIEGAAGADGAAAGEAACYQPGDKVLIYGLTSPAGLELNDRRGTIISFDTESGRYVVAVVGMTRQKRLKHKNLRPLAQALAERKRLAVAFEHV